MFFKVRIGSKSPAEFSPPIGAFMELRYNANLPCLVNLAPSVLYGLLLIIFSCNNEYHIFSTVVVET